MPGPGQGLDLPTLKLEIIQAQKDAAKETTISGAQNVFAESLSLAIDKFVKSGKVITTGTAVTQQGAVT